jgi:tRNA modification GTPase
LTAGRGKTVSAEDTIFARATAPGPAAIAVIRVSGPNALPAVAALSSTPLPPRRASLRTLRDPRSAVVLDEALVVAFPGPASFTGEDMVEIQCHGGRAVIEAVQRALAAHPGLRSASPGEFTRRALERGRLSLSQVEGLSDLLVAETEAQRRQAISLMQGRLAAMSAAWQSRIADALALIEAAIDFADEDLPDALWSEARSILLPVVGAMEGQLAGSLAAERVREGFEVALVGPPNVGKSTLLNALAGRSVAITSAQPGTTRDVIELRVDLQGLPVTFLDMAGIRETDDPIEAEGVRMAKARAAGADLRLILSDGTYENETQVQDGDLLVECKADIRPELGGLAVSAARGYGLDRLLEVVHKRLDQKGMQATLPAHARQRLAISEALEALARALALLEDADDAVELAAADLRLASSALDGLAGRVDVEHVLDRIFARFCLGK